MSLSAKNPNDSGVVVVFDLDGTLTRSDTFTRYLIWTLQRTPRRWLHLPALAVSLLMLLIGIRDNEWLKTVALRVVFAGEDRRLETARTSQFIRMVLDRMMRPGGLAQLKKHQSLNHKVILLTASPDFYVDQLASSLGFDTTLCTNTVRDAQNRLTGELIGRNCYGAEKVHRLESYLEASSPARLIVYADSYSDLPLFRRADERYAVNPSGRLRKVALEHQIEILSW